MEKVVNWICIKRTIGTVAIALLLLGGVMSRDVGAQTGETFGLSFSTSPTRTAPMVLTGMLSGTVRIFLTPLFPVSSIRNVKFYVDDPGLGAAPFRRERRAPYDLAGGSVSKGRAFTVDTLGGGLHNVTALITFGDGSTQAVSTDFSVAGAPPPPPAPSPSPVSSFAFGHSFAADRSVPEGLIPNALELLPVLSGEVFFFLGAASNCTALVCPPVTSSTGVSRVEFFLDDVHRTAAPFHVEKAAPYDFVGGGTATARPLDLDLLTPGNHALTALIVRSDGSTEVVTSLFTSVFLDAIIPPSLKTAPVITDPDLLLYIKDLDAAYVLGRALFWDIQAGSDGEVACATCHYHAGADNRINNTLHPGANGMFDYAAGDFSGGTLSAADFPFHQFANPTDPLSAILRSVDDIVGSQGVLKKDFVGVDVGSPIDFFSGPLSPEGVFLDEFLTPTRQATGRNTPTNINAIFNVRSFLDGRANFVFNGASPFGARDTAAFIYENCADPPACTVNGPIGGIPIQQQLRLRFASLASQAVGPPLSGVEMSWNGRNFPKLGRKLMALRPLQLQAVDADDSAFGPLGPLGDIVDPSGMGITAMYADLIEQAFADHLWNGADVVINGQTFTQKEANFAVFWGLAIQIWEAALISDDSPFDRFRDGTDVERLAKLEAVKAGAPGALLTPQEFEGLLLFIRDGACVFCHGGPVFSAATLPFLLQAPLPGEPPEQVLEVMLMQAGVDALLAGDLAPPSAVYDLGFYNLGVRPTSEDLGIGGFDGIPAPGHPGGHPLSFSAQLSAGELVDDLSQAPLQVDPCAFIVGPCVPVAIGQRTAVDGAFKVPSLRNIDLTGPYMHNGGMKSLEEVIQFYTRGADFGAANIDNLDPEVIGIPVLQGNQAGIDALLAFLRTLTDDRVRRGAAPFDHPSLPLPNGDFIPAVGASGGAPLTSFASKLAAGPLCSSDAECDNGLFCDGAEICNLTGACVAGTDPCPGATCDEAGNVCVAAPPSSFALMVSLNPDRSAAVDLAGANVTGSVRIFLTPLFPTVAISKVRFFLDNPGLVGRPNKRERLAPYDLAGGSVAHAKAFNTNKLSAGAHTLSAEILFADGSSEVVSVPFTH